MKSKKFGLGLLLVSLVSFASAHMGESSSENYSWMGGMMGGHHSYLGMGFMWLIGLLFIVVLVLLGIWLSKQIWRK